MYCRNCSPCLKNQRSPPLFVLYIRSFLCLFKLLVYPIWGTYFSFVRRNKMFLMNDPLFFFLIRTFHPKDFMRNSYILKVISQNIAYVLITMCKSIYQLSVIFEKKLLPFNRFCTRKTTYILIANLRGIF